VSSHLARRPGDPGEDDCLIILAFDRHGKRRDLAVGHIVPPTLDEFQCTVLLEDDGSGFCMFLRDFAIGGGDGRNKSIDVGDDVSPSV
jgi:hypothetical protein